MNKKVYKLGKEFINIDFIKTMTKPKRMQIECNKDYEYIYFKINDETYYKENYNEHKVYVIDETPSPLHKWQIYFSERLKETTYELKEDIDLKEYNDFCIEAENLFNAFINK